MEPVFDVPLDVSPPATPIAAHISAVMCGVPVVFLFIFESRPRVEGCDATFGG